MLGVCGISRNFLLLVAPAKYLMSFARFRCTASSTSSRSSVGKEARTSLRPAQTSSARRVTCFALQGRAMRCCDITGLTMYILYTERSWKGFIDTTFQKNKLRDRFIYIYIFKMYIFIYTFIYTNIFKRYIYIYCTVLLIHLHYLY